MKPPEAILVTGGARRLGRSMLLRLAAPGRRLGVHFNASEAEALETVEECRRLGAIAQAFQADLRSPDETEALIRAAAEGLDGLDALVNNASTYFPAKLGEVAPGQYDALMDVNARAAFFASQAAARIMEASGGGGCIVNVADAMWERPSPSYIPYMMGKAAVVCMTRGMARALGPKNIRVNAIAPGAVLPPEDASEEAVARSVAKAPMGRLGSPEDIAEALEFLLFRAPYVTGAILPVDGGRSAWG